MRKNFLTTVVILGVVLTFTACGNNTGECITSDINNEKSEIQTEMKMNVQVGDYTFTATLENNTAVFTIAE